MKVVPANWLDILTKLIVVLKCLRCFLLVDLMSFKLKLLLPLLQFLQMRLVEMHHVTYCKHILEVAPHNTFEEFFVTRVILQILGVCNFELALVLQVLRLRMARQAHPRHSEVKTHPLEHESSSLLDSFNPDYTFGVEISWQFRVARNAHIRFQSRVCVKHF